MFGFISSRGGSLVYAQSLQLTFVPYPYLIITFCQPAHSIGPDAVIVSKYSRGLPESQADPVILPSVAAVQYIPYFQMLGLMNLKHCAMRPLQLPHPLFDLPYRLVR